MERKRSQTDEPKSQSFQIKKTELVPVKDPYQLLRNLKAENIIPERKYKQLKVQLRDRQETGMSELLAWLEKEAPEKIGPFWNTAQRGGAQACTELQLCRADHAPVRELVLPVTCGGKQGRFDVGKYLEGQPCVLANRKWMSPQEFEKHGGKGRNHKWKSSIRYKGRPLGALLEGDQPAKPVPKRKPTRSQSQIKSTASPEAKRRKRSSSPDSRETVHQAQQTSTESEESDGVSWRSSDTEEEDESEESSEEEEEDSPSSSGQEEQEEEEGGERGGSVFIYRDVLAVTCGSDKGKLYRKRFANACRGRCIRTFRQWCTPLEFCRTGTPGADEGNWAQSIWHMGVPLANLIQLGILRPHPEDCSCVNPFLDIPLKVQFEGKTNRMSANPVVRAGTSSAATSVFGFSTANVTCRPSPDRRIHRQNGSAHCVSSAEPWSSCLGSTAGRRCWGWRCRASRRNVCIFSSDCTASKTVALSLKIPAVSRDTVRSSSAPCGWIKSRRSSWSRSTSRWASSSRTSGSSSRTVSSTTRNTSTREWGKSSGGSSRGSSNTCSTSATKTRSPGSHNEGDVKRSQSLWFIVQPGGHSVHLLPRIHSFPQANKRPRRRF